MNEGEDQDKRLAALCRSLGELWSEEDVVIIRGDVPSINAFMAQLALEIFSRCWTNALA